MGENSKSNDIYSLTAALYEALSGEPPFHSGGVYEQIQHKPASSLPDQPDHVNAALLAGLGKQPEDRPESAVELATMLRSPTPSTRKAELGRPPADEPARTGESSRTSPGPRWRGNSKVVRAVLLGVVCCLILVWVRGACESARRTATRNADSERSTAGGLKSQISKLDREDGFGAMIDEALALHTKAHQSYTQESYRRAAKDYIRFQVQCRSLLVLDKKRGAARDLNNRVATVRDRARSIPDYPHPEAVASRANGEKHWLAGVEAFGKGSFDRAQQEWERANTLFQPAASVADQLEQLEQAKNRFDAAYNAADLCLVREFVPELLEQVEAEVKAATQETGDYGERSARFATAAMLLKDAHHQARILRIRGTEDPEQAMVLLMELNPNRSSDARVRKLFNDIAPKAGRWWLAQASRGASWAYDWLAVARAAHAIGQTNDRRAALNKAIEACKRLDNIDYGMQVARAISTDACKYSDRGIAKNGLREWTIFANQIKDTSSKRQQYARIAAHYGLLRETEQAGRFLRVAIPNKTWQSITDVFSYADFWGLVGDLDKLLRAADYHPDRRYSQCFGYRPDILAKLVYYAARHNNASMHRTASLRLQQELSTHEVLHHTPARLRRCYSCLARASALLGDIRNAEASLSHIKTGTSDRRSAVLDIAIAWAKKGNWQKARTLAEGELQGSNRARVYGWIGAARAKGESANAIGVYEWASSLPNVHKRTCALAGAARGFAGR